MNKSRRKSLQLIFDEITELKDKLEIILDEEECYRDNIPENLQASERYEKAEAATEKIYEAVSYLENAAYELDEIINE